MVESYPEAYDPLPDEDDMDPNDVYGSEGGYCQYYLNFGFCIEYEVCSYCNPDLLVEEEEEESIEESKVDTNTQFSKVPEPFVPSAFNASSAVYVPSFKKPKDQFNLESQSFKPIPTPFTKDSAEFKPKSSFKNNDPF